MNKNELAIAIADRTETTQVQAKAFLDAFTAVVQETVAAGDEKVVIPGFGTWERKFSDARTATNPATGGTIDVPAKYRASFKVGSTFKDVVANGKTA